MLSRRKFLAGVAVAALVPAAKAEEFTGLIPCNTIAWGLGECDSASIWLVSWGEPGIFHRYAPYGDVARDLSEFIGDDRLTESALHRYNVTADDPPDLSVSP